MEPRFRITGIRLVVCLHRAKLLNDVFFVPATFVNKSNTSALMLYASQIPDLDHLVY